MQDHKELYEQSIVDRLNLRNQIERNDRPHALASAAFHPVSCFFWGALATLAFAFAATYHGSHAPAAAAVFPTPTLEQRVTDLDERVTYIENRSHIGRPVPIWLRLPNQVVPQVVPPVSR